MVAGFLGVQGFDSTVARAKEIAKRRGGQRLTTAHILCALWQGDERAMHVCMQLGLSEPRLLAALGPAHEERHNAIDLALERARTLSMELGRGPDALCLLAAITRDARSAASLALGHAGVVADDIAALALRTGGVSVAVPSQKPAAQPQVEAQPQAQKVKATATAMPTRRRRDHGVRSATLARQTESKLRMERELPLETPKPAVAQAQIQVQPALEPKSEPPRAPRSTPAKPQAKQGAAQDYALDPQAFPLLSAIGRNLTLAAAAGQIDEVIGRDHEIDVLLDVLARRRGNNPVLVGPPGVGKTAVVEGLALELLRAGDRRVLIELSSSGLLAGTGVRGAVSERLGALRAEVKKSEGCVLLFLDEVHTVIGGAEPDSLGNELKAALARGELPMIGATTDAEYRKVFERDAALSRRFTRVEIGEPSREDALAIVSGVAPHYEAHHGVRYEAAALSAAVDMSVRFLPERQLPDKAIALLDQAGARVRRRGKQRVDVQAVASVVSELASVPVERLMMQDGEALLSLEAHLAERVVGQSAAISCIANALRKSAAGFLGARPLGTFLFLGPTGVGKTEMAKAIAERMFPGAPLTRIDMSELGESHAVARLLGAPPGYVGHEEAGQLTEAVRHRPYQLVLLDEIEKAHPDVLLALLPLLDEGRLTDGRGRTVDFTNTVIVMTSNLGAESAVARSRIGFGGESDTAASDASSPDMRARDRALAAARAAMPPELWNRIDEPLYFQPLSESEVMKVARRMLGEVAKVAFEKHAVVLAVETSALLALVAAGGFDRALGARPMRRTISRLVEAPLARALLGGELQRGERVTLHADNGPLEFAPQNRDGAAAE